MRRIVICSYLIAATRLSAAPKIALLDPVIRLASGSTTETVLLKVKAEGLSAADLASPVKPVLIETSKPAPPGGVQFSFYAAEDRRDAARIWYFSAVVRDLPPFVTQRRSARLQFNQIDEQFNYLITNQASKASLWTVLAPPDPWVISTWPDQPHSTSLDLITGDAAVTGVKLAHFDITEPTTKRAVGPSQLKLCRQPCGPLCSGEAINLAANSSNTLYLCVGELPGFGNYRGQLHLSAVEKPETQSVLLHLLVSSVWAKMAGLLTILGGVILAWLARVYAGNKVAREYDLLPVALQRQRLSALRTEISMVPAGLEESIAGMRSALDDWLNVRLTEAYLDARHYLHPEAALPSLVLKRRTDYAAFLGKVDAEVNRLLVLVMDGVRKVLILWNPVTMPERRADAEAALRRIDRLLGQTPSVASSQAAVRNILDALRTKLISSEFVESDLDGDPSECVIFQKLVFRLKRESLLMWTIAGTATALAGLFTLILNNPGFGIPKDYLYCFLWGFGIPAAAHLTPELGAQRVVISLPKAA